MGSVEFFFFVYFGRVFFKWRHLKSLASVEKNTLRHQSTGAGGVCCKDLLKTPKIFRRFAPCIFNSTPSFSKREFPTGEKMKSPDPRLSRKKWPPTPVGGG